MFQTFPDFSTLISRKFLLRFKKNITQEGIAVHGKPWFNFVVWFSLHLKSHKILLKKLWGKVSKLDGGNKNQIVIVIRC